MQPAVAVPAEFSPPKRSGASLDPQILDRLTASAEQLGLEVVDIAGFLDDLAHRSARQISLLDDAGAAVTSVVDVTGLVRDTAREVAQSAEAALTSTGASIEAIKASSDQSSDIAEWVAGAGKDISDAVESLRGMETSNAEVKEIANEIRFLSINARIEASRAGDMGRGFSLIAENINEASARTNEVADRIQDTLAQLDQTIRGLQRSSKAVSDDARRVIADTAKTADTLADMASQIAQANTHAERIQSAAQDASQATSRLQPAFKSVGASVRETSERIHGVTDRAQSLVNLGEEILQRSVSVGGASKNNHFIKRVMEDADYLSRQLEEALSQRDISTEDLFCRRYTPVAGSNPAQVEAPFTGLTDRLFGPVQEEALTFDKRVVFCAAVNQDGYLPTHNRKFSQPQGADVDWNTANCRNRRIFDDRVGLKAGRNTEPFLLQTYRRDMGGGKFKLMMDVSAPIVVHGQNWGGLRLAFTA